jgi:superkiller protein 3
MMPHKELNRQSNTHLLRTEHETAVPVDLMLALELETLGRTSEKQDMLEKYEVEYVIPLMNRISELLGSEGHSAENRDQMAKAISEVRECDLFKFVSYVFYQELGRTYKADTYLVASIEEGAFNCFTSAVLFADVLTRIGKCVNIVTTPDHVLLAGEYFAFETTISSSIDRTYNTLNEDKHVFPKTKLHLKYPAEEIDETDTYKLLSEVYVWRGHRLYDRGDSVKEAYDAYDEASKAYPKHSEAWHGKGRTLHLLGRDLEAISAYDEALKMCKKDKEIWHDKGVALESLGRHEEANRCFGVEIGMKVEEELRKAKLENPNY